MIPIAFLTLCLTALSSAELKWDENGMYRVVETNPAPTEQYRHIAIDPEDKEITAVASDDLTWDQNGMYRLVGSKPVQYRTLAVEPEHKEIVYVPASEINSDHSGAFQYRYITINPEQKETFQYRFANPEVHEGVLTEKIEENSEIVAVEPEHQNFQYRYITVDPDHVPVSSSDDLKWDENGMYQLVGTKPVSEVQYRNIDVGAVQPEEHNFQYRYITVDPDHIPVSSSDDLKWDENGMYQLVGTKPVSEIQYRNIDVGAVLPEEQNFQYRYITVDPEHKETSQYRFVKPEETPVVPLEKNSEEHVAIEPEHHNFRYITVDPDHVPVSASDNLKWDENGMYQLVGTKPVSEVQFRNIDVEAVQPEEHKFQYRYITVDPDHIPVSSSDDLKWDENGMYQLVGTKPVSEIQYRNIDVGAVLPEEQNFQYRYITVDPEHKETFQYRFVKPEETPVVPLEKNSEEHVAIEPEHHNFRYITVDPDHVPVSASDNLKWDENGMYQLVGTKPVSEVQFRNIDVGAVQPEEHNFQYRYITVDPDHIPVSSSDDLKWDENGMYQLVGTKPVSEIQYRNIDLGAVQPEEHNFQYRYITVDPEHKETFQYRFVKPEVTPAVPLEKDSEEHVAIEPEHYNFRYITVDPDHIPVSSLDDLKWDENGMYKLVGTKPVSEVLYRHMALETEPKEMMHIVVPEMKTDSGMYQYRYIVSNPALKDTIQYRVAEPAEMEMIEEKMEGNCEKVEEHMEEKAEEKIEEMPKDTIKINVEEKPIAFVSAIPKSHYEYRYIPYPMVKLEAKEPCLQH